MRFASLALLLLLNVAISPSAIVDRIAMIVNGRVVKATDIERDLRLTGFLNGDPLELGPDGRKKAAHRLIDQQIIRREVEVGHYPIAAPQEIDAFLKTIKEQRFSGDTAYSDALKRYGVTEPELRDHLQWQITVLHYIDQRFRPAVIVRDPDIDAYVKAHNVSREQAQETLTGEKVNSDFDSWLNRAEKRATVQYREEGLK